MKLTESQLRRIIRQVVSECYGWPVEKEEPLYGVKHPKGPSTRDPKNPQLKMPKGPNSAGVNESFKRITQKEFEAWKSGDWGFIDEDAED